MASCRLALPKAAFSGCLQCCPQRRIQLQGWMAPHRLTGHHMKLGQWAQRRTFQCSPYRLLPEGPPKAPPEPSTSKTPIKDLYENIYTLPNLLTLSRILSCPAIGYFIVNGEFGYATALLLYAGISDLVDGYIARTYHKGSVLGSILDPAADKLLMTTLTITLAVRGLLPTWLAAIIIGRDVLLSISAFYWRYVSLPPPKTFSRYWNFSIPSAEVHPTQISKYNTFLQLALMGSTTIAPLLPYDLAMPLLGLQYTVAATTVASGLSYVFAKDAVKVLGQQ